MVNVSSLVWIFCFAGSVLMFDLSPEDEEFIPIRNGGSSGRRKRLRGRSSPLHSETLGGSAVIIPEDHNNRSLAAFVAPEEGSGDGGSGDFPEPAPCRSHQDCSQGLNERCIGLESFNRNPGCDCASAFARNKLTRVCQEKVSLRGKLNCPQVEFPKNSPQAHGFENQVVRTLTEAVQLTRHARHLVGDIQILGLHPPIIQFRMSLAAGGINASQAEAFLRRELGGALEQMGHRPELLDLRGATVETIVAEDPCQGPNYCSPNAECQMTPQDPTRAYRCRCKPNYADNSPNIKIYPGEDCRIVCPQGYCSNEGSCYAEKDELICRCHKGFYGKTCEISLIAVAGILSGTLCFLVLAICTIILVLYKQKSGSNGNSVTNIPVGPTNKGGHTGDEGPSANGATGLTVVISCDDATLPSKDKMTTPKKEATPHKEPEAKENGSNA